MKTGIIIEANIEGTEINNISVHRTFIPNEDWAPCPTEFTKHEIDAWLELIVQGTITIISGAEKNGFGTESDYLRDVIKRLQDAFVEPSNTSLINNKEVKHGYK